MYEIVPSLPMKLERGGAHRSTAKMEVEVP